MDERAKPLADLLELNHRLVLNCLDDVSDAQARTRVVPGLNSVSFLLAHLIDVRHTLLRMLGGNQPNPVAAALMQHESYHLGQIALLRRAHDLPAMRYRARPTPAP